MTDALPPRSLARRPAAPSTVTRPVASPIQPSVVWRAEDADALDAQYEGRTEGFAYARESHPNAVALARQIDALEGTPEGSGGGLCFGSGMGAVSAVLLGLLKSGDRVIASSQLYGRSLRLMTQDLPRFGIETTVIDSADDDAWEAAIRPNTKVFFFETPANPTLDVVDLAHVCGVAQAHGITTVVDNAFATSALQRPMDFGADVVAYSATKLMDGQGRVLAGAVCGSQQWIDEVLLPFQRNTGPNIAPFNAWVVLKGLETLDLRARRQSENAVELGQFMEGRVPKMLHPGLPSHPRHDLASKQMVATGPIFAFDVGDRATAFSILDALELVDISNNIGDARSLMCHPASTTHAGMTQEDRDAMGVTEGLLRINVGLEDVEDVKEDIDRALTAAGL